MTFVRGQFVLQFAIPNFLFHVTTGEPRQTPITRTPRKC